MTLRASVETVHLAFRDPLRVAHAGWVPDGADTVLVEVSGSELGPRTSGLGEGFPAFFYGETTETMRVVIPLLLQAVRAAVGPTVADLVVSGDPASARANLERASIAMDHALAHNGAAKSAIDIALHDLVGRAIGLPVHELLGTSSMVPPTDFTLGIDDASVVAERAIAAARFPALKVKLGGPADVETLEAVRSVYGGPIRVDANTGWDPEEGARLIPELVRLGVELIEQPFPAHRLDQVRWLQERSVLPIVADESAVTIDDLPRLVGVCAGVNVKLDKCGGVGPAARMLRRARELGFKLMLGCMVETSVGIAAGASVASLVDWLDLDGNLIVTDDPFEGPVLDDACRWRLAAGPGLAVAPRQARQPEASPVRGARGPGYPQREHGAADRTPPQLDSWGGRT